MPGLSAVLAIETDDLRAAIRQCVSKAGVQVIAEEKSLSPWGAVLARTEKARPDLVMVEAARCASAEECIRGMRRLSCTPAVFVVHDSLDPALILRVMHARAVEYIYPPFEPLLPDAIRRLAAEHFAQKTPVAPGKTLAFLSVKGGCGATTVACHTAAALHQVSGKHVLLADFDLDAGILGFLLKSESSYTVVDALAIVDRLDQSYWSGLVSNGVPGLQLIQAPPPLGIRSRTLEGFSQLVSFTRMHYDWVIADLGRSVNTNVLDALGAIDECFLVASVDVPALHQAKLAIRLLRESGYPADRQHLVLNRVPKRCEITSDDIRNLLQMPIAAVLPDDFEAVYNAHADGRLLALNTGLGKRFVSFAATLVSEAEAHAKKGGQ